MKRKSAVRFWERLDRFLATAEVDELFNREELTIAKVHIPNDNPELGAKEPFIGYVKHDSKKEVWETDVVDDETKEETILRYDSGEVVKGETFYYFIVNPPEEDSSESESSTEEVGEKTAAG